MLNLITESVHELRILIDFGLVILIWLVQLIIYPSFRYTQTENFLPWHQKYMFLITLIVGPLMFGQAALVLVQLFTTTSVPVIASAILILLIWLSTFLQAVPTHDRLAAGNHTAELVEKLILVNWPRTVLWTIVFLLGLLEIR